jgi:hypothetical protein
MPADPALPPPAIGRFVEKPAQLYRQAHRALFAYWDSKRPGPDRLPSRADIDPAEIPALLSRIWMTDVLHTETGLRFRERLVGTGLVELFGRDTTGQDFAQIYREPHLSRQLATYGAVVEHRRPHLSRLRVPKAERSFLIYDRLILPLAAPGDGPVTILLGAHAYHPEPGEDPAQWPAPDCDTAANRG